jgi:class 3 adenylate cyclase
MRIFFLLVFILLTNDTGSAQNRTLIESLKQKSKSLSGIEKVNVLNDLVDELLKPSPNEENCKAAKDFANDAAKISESLDYKLGMARSFEQLTLIYKTLEYQVQYLKWRNKAAKVPRGQEMKKQQEELERQKAMLSKQGEQIQTQNQELVKKERALGESVEQVEQLNQEKYLMNLRNEMLEQQKQNLKQESEIKEISLEKEKLRNRLLLTILGIILVLTAVLFRLFKSKQRIAKELAEKNVIIETEKERSEELLLNILPLETANELKLTGKAQPKNYKAVTVMFTDFKDFTIIGEKLTPKELVGEIDHCFSAFDAIMEKYGIEKIKTIGDAYLCVHGLHADIKHDPGTVVMAAKEIIQFIEELKEQRKTEGRYAFSIRIGIHSGPVVAGVVGKKKFAYDIWGDAVNTAARMEQNSEPGKINVSQATYELLKDDFSFEYRGKIEAKNKGEIDMYFVKV